MQMRVLLSAVPWMLDGWVTVVTGRGRGCNRAECLRRLAVLQHMGMVAEFRSPADSGAVYVRLKEPSKHQVCNDLQHPAVLCGICLS